MKAQPSLSRYHIMIITMTSMQSNNNLNVLIADDDQDDWYFASLAFKEAGLNHNVNFVKDGQELMDYLEQTQSTDRSKGFPDLILLDLNMPKKDGRIALKEIKSDPRFQKVNVVIFSTTISDEDKATTIEASQHITKPFEFSELVQTIKDV